MSDLSKYTEQQLKDNIKAKKEQYTDAQNSKDPKERAKAPKYKIGLDRLEKELVSRKQQEQVTTAKAHKDMGKSTSKKPVPAKGAKNVIKVRKCIITKCPPKPKPLKPKNKVKFIGNICITIDHLGTGLAKTSLQVVKELRGLKNSKGLNIPVPVTVFVTCRAGGKKMMKKPAQFKIKQTDRQAIATFTENDMKMIMDMKALGAEIGVHLLGTLDVKGLNEETAAQKQIDNINYIRTAELNFNYKKYKKGTLVVGNVKTASYHGDEIEKVAGLKNTTVQNSFKCIRGTGSSKPKAKGLTKYTPVFYHTGDIKKNVEKNPESVTHFFFHSHQTQTTSKKLYDELLNGLKSGKYKAVPYCSK